MPANSKVIIFFFIIITLGSYISQNGPFSEPYKCGKLCDSLWSHYSIGNGIHVINSG